jgi:hypothetical protein
MVAGSQMSAPCSCREYKAVSTLVDEQNKNKFATLILLVIFTAPW